MTSTLPTSGPLGFEVRPETALLTCTNALVEGDLVMLTLSSGAYTACTKSATADSTPDHILGVALRTVAAGAVGEIAIKGQVKVSRHDTGAAGLAVICGGAAGRVTAAPTDPTDDGSAYIKVVGIALEAAGSAGNLVECMFDGLNGFASTNN
tara:strand:+ start:762 stop:1217 length:456 start_codon:yes stop_codon:yes gene_type:complete